MKASRVGALLGSLIFLVGLFLLPAAAFAQSPERPETDEGKEAIAVAGDSVFEQSEEREPIETLVPERDHWIYLMGRNAIWGGVVGSLIGVGVYLVTGLEASPWIIAQFAGGGILIGAVTGMVEGLFAPDVLAAVDEAPASVDWVQRDIPTTVKAPVIRIQF